MSLATEVTSFAFQGRQPSLFPAERGPAPSLNLALLDLFEQPNYLPPDTEVNSNLKGKLLSLFNLGVASPAKAPLNQRAMVITASSSNGCVILFAVRPTWAACCPMSQQASS